MLENIKKNLKSGLTVSLISIPLSVSLAVASGATPVIGIITAIWAGLIAALFGGSNFNIVGPTGALSGIIATYVLLHGLSTLPVLAILVGVFILVAYFLKLERYLILIPSSVIHGFTLGVAFIIGFGQLNFALGLENLTKHERFIANLMESFAHINQTSFISLSVFIVFLVGLILFKKWNPKLPGAIILAPVGILLGYLSQAGVIPVAINTLGGKFPEMDFSFFIKPSFEFSGFMLETAAMIALIAILETMLSAKIADGMTKTKHNERKEMFGLGLANIASGLFGGMPATAALARTSLNIKTGATHKTSGVISVLGIVLISALLLGYFKFIPLAVIAAILVSVAIGMVEAHHFRKFWKYEKTGFYISIFVAIITMVIDPIYGILIGVSMALLVFIDQVSHGYFEVRVNDLDKGIIDSDAGTSLKEIEEDADVLLYSFRDKLCYINNRAHLKRFEENLIKYKTIILRLREVHFVDTDGLEALDEIINIVEARGQKVLLCSIDPGVIDLLERLSGGYKRLKGKGLVFQKTEEALKYLGIPTGK